MTNFEGGDRVLALDDDLGWANDTDEYTMRTRRKPMERYASSLTSNLHPSPTSSSTMSGMNPGAFMRVQREESFVDTFNTERDKSRRVA